MNIIYIIIKKKTMQVESTSYEIISCYLGK